MIPRQRSLDKEAKMRNRLHQWMDANKAGRDGAVFHATDDRVLALLKAAAGILDPQAGQKEAMVYVEALRTVERALAAGVPEGWKLVPIAITSQMEDAYDDKFQRDGACDMGLYIPAYEAMLAAAPTPPATVSKRGMSTCACDETKLGKAQ